MKVHQSLLAVLIVAGVLLFTTAGAAQTVRYVDLANDSGTETGATWSTAHRSLQSAISSASPGEEIWVAAGVYVGALVLPDGVAIYGGFAGGETALAQRNVTANVTTINGGGASPAVHCAKSNARLDGFTITGDGLLIFQVGGYVNATVEIANCITIGNGSNYGAHCITLGGPAFSNCSFTGGNYGVTILNGASPTLTSCTVSGNNYGVYCHSNSTPRLTDCTIKDNAWTGVSVNGGEKLYQVAE